jgi:hypothetical protein
MIKSYCADMFVLVLRYCVANMSNNTTKNVIVNFVLFLGIRS